MMDQVPYPDRPKWVFEHLALMALLHKFIDKLDENQKHISVKLDQKNLPGLFEYGTDDTTFLWDLINDLQNEFEIYLIKKPRSKPGLEEYEGASLKFNKQKEGLLRFWLNRPRVVPYRAQWKQVIESVQEAFKGEATVLIENPIQVADKNAEQVVAAFIAMEAYLSELSSVISLRSLSAKFFWGRSKLLDGKAELVTALFPNLVSKIVPRPLMFTAYIPDDFSEVLFIENQDTFLAMSAYMGSQEANSGIALVYSRGFEVSASRVRQPGQAVFSTINCAAYSAKDILKRWWFNLSEHNIPCYFWGDLDFSGIAILISLEKAFPNIGAWRPGYDAMLMLHKSGFGHLQSEAVKQNQLEPSQVQCNYANKKLLPLLTKTKRFIDQEAVSIEELMTGISM